MEQFYSLDGNLYSFVDSQLELEQILDQMQSYEPGIYKIFSSQIDPNILDESIIKNFNHLKKLSYNTNFFEITLSDIPNIIANLATTYAQKVSPIYHKIEPHSDPKEVAKLLDFSLHVSAYKQINGNWIGDPYRIQRCESFFNQALSQENLYAYLVSNLSDQLGGSFCLVETKNDIQLESVSGKSQKYQTFSGYKFPYLMTTILEVYSKKFSQKPLRFSSSKEKVIKLYEQAGCKKSNRLHAVKIEVFR